MAYLFIIENKKLNPNPETLLIPEFKKIWDRDESKDKHIAMMEFAYIEFMTSYKKSNPYKDYPKDIKEETIIKEVITEKNWTPDAAVKAAMDKIVEIQQEGSITYRYWMSNKEAAEKLIIFFETFDMDERTDKNIPIYKPRDITSALKDARTTLETITDLKKRVEEELFESTKVRGNKEISPFSDPTSLI
jgi:hypothetical protein